MNKKDLKQAYKQHKPDMGVYAFTCRATGKAYLGYGHDVKSDINSITFRLNLGSFYSKCNLQNDWVKYGETNFEIIIVELLKYDKDETKTDYQADLRILRELCAEKLKEYELIQD